MFKNHAIAASAAIIATLALPLPSLATMTTNALPQRYRLDTRMVSQFEAGEYDGTLTLTVYPNGIVQGTYLPFDGSYRSVTGGIKGRNIWLDIGENGRLHLTGTFEHGILNSVVQKPGPDVTTFDAVPIRK
jgi:hypothetical protein